MSTHNIGFNEELTNIFQLSSNTHLICSSEIIIRYTLNRLTALMKKLNIKEARSALFMYF